MLLPLAPYVFSARWIALRTLSGFAPSRSAIRIGLKANVAHRHSRLGGCLVVPTELKREQPSNIVEVCYYAVVLCPAHDAASVFFFPREFFFAALASSSACHTM